MPSDTKLDKRDPAVMYQWQPVGKQNCANCSMFIPNAACTAVVGMIVRNGWCRLWQDAKR